MFCLSTHCAFCVLDKLRLCPISCSCETVSPLFAADHCQLDLSSRTGDCALRDCHGNRGPVDYRNYHTVANCVNPGCRNAEPHPETQVFLRLLNLNHEAPFRGNSPLKQQEHSLEMWNSWIPTRRGVLQWLAQHLHGDMTLPYCISCRMRVAVDFGGGDEGVRAGMLK